MQFKEQEEEEVCIEENEEGGRGWRLNQGGLDIHPPLAEQCRQFQSQHKEVKMQEEEEEEEEEEEVEQEDEEEEWSRRRRKKRQDAGVDKLLITAALKAAHCVIQQMVWMIA